MLGRMTLGEKLLELTSEYRDVKDAAIFDGNPGGRKPSEIAAEYEETLRALLGVDA